MKDAEGIILGSAVHFASAAFDQLNKCFTICQMPIVSSNYWNQIHGYTPEDVMKDVYWMQWKTYIKKEK